MLPNIIEGIARSGYTSVELKNDHEKMREIAKQASSQILKRKDEVEIFMALFGHLEFYQKGSKICFVLKNNVDPRKVKITTLKDLKDCIKEDQITDFAIFSNDGLRQFQLKQYRGTLDTENLFQFIQGKVSHYAKDLGETNLLVILQSKEADLKNVDFEELCRKLNNMGIRSETEILISYNENNEFNVTNRVYPSLGTCRIPIILPSQRK
jgi:hypothetical protein